MSPESSKLSVGNLTLALWDKQLDQRNGTQLEPIVKAFSVKYPHYFPIYLLGLRRTISCITRCSANAQTHGRPSPSSTHSLHFVVVVAHESERDKPNIRTAHPLSAKPLEAIPTTRCCVWFQNTITVEN